MPLTALLDNSKNLSAWGSERIPSSLGMNTFFFKLIKILTGYRQVGIASDAADVIGRDDGVLARVGGGGGRQDQGVGAVWLGHHLDALTIWNYLLAVAGPDTRKSV